MFSQNLPDQPATDGVDSVTGVSSPNVTVPAPIVPETRLQSWGQQLLKWLLPSDQPQITWKRDRHGHSFYQVYDPKTQKTYDFDTSKAVRIWLETRY